MLKVYSIKLKDRGSRKKRKKKREKGEKGRETGQER